MDFILHESNWIKLVTNDALSSLYAWHVFDIWKTFCQKQYNVLVGLIYEKRGSTDKLSDDCYCDLSVSILNGYTTAVSEQYCSCTLNKKSFKIEHLKLEKDLAVGSSLLYIKPNPNVKVKIWDLSELRQVLLRHNFL